MLANDTDPDDDPLSVTTSTPEAEHGDVACTDAGVCTYTPDAGFSGDGLVRRTRSATVTAGPTGEVSVEVTPAEPGNADPQATDDELVTDAGAPGRSKCLRTTPTRTAIRSR